MFDIMQLVCFWVFRVVISLETIRFAFSNKYDSALFFCVSAVVYKQRCYFFIKSDQEKAKVFDMVERFVIKGGRDFF